MVLLAVPEYNVNKVDINWRVSYAIAVRRMYHAGYGKIRPVAGRSAAVSHR